ncbi:MAG: hypothetical protein IJ864_05685 [Alphaproteobacteria bacterium]|nr:hypothetical protein [Alphaproteobacteria bacterium]
MMNRLNFLKHKINLFILFSFAVIGACNAFQDDETVITSHADEDISAGNYMVFPQQDPYMLRTIHRAYDLDLETPLRCHVNWKTQEMVQILPHNNVSFKLERNDVNDPLPDFEVKNFSFDNLTADQALLKLTREAGITLVAKDAPYPTLYGENLNGSFKEVLDHITQSADVFYRYDAKMNSIILNRRGSFTMYTPSSRTILLGFLDVLRGAGITDMVTNWRDYTISFEANLETIDKVNTLVADFEDNPTMIMYDVSVFRVIAKEPCGIVWKDLLKDFQFGSIATTQTGVIGRVLTVTNDISKEHLQQFVAKYGTVQDISEGHFVVPTRWFSRFDVGRCGKLDNMEYPLSILAKAGLEKNNRIYSEITLDTTDGEITKFKVRNKLGENFLIIGLPSEIFGSAKEGTETIVFIVPRLVRMLKTDEKIKNQIQ